MDAAGPTPQVGGHHDPDRKKHEMRKLLYVNSRHGASAGVASHRRRVPADLPPALAGVAVELLDLWTEPLPVFAGKGVAAKMSVFAGPEPNGEEGDAWAEVRSIFERFDAADEYLFTVPMWNHGAASLDRAPHRHDQPAGG